MTRPADRHADHGDDHRDHHRGDHRDDDGDMARVARAVRSASGPALSGGAACRIADGAWAQAEQAAGRGAARPTLGALAPALHRSTIRRLAVAAAAVIAIGVGAYTLQPVEPAFAIDGDPVQVLRGNRWVNESRSVRPGATVFVAGGSCTLRGPGAQIVPEPGSTFRIIGESGTAGFRIEILGGGAEVSGDAIHLAMADMDVRPKPAGGAVRVFATVPPILAGVPTEQLRVNSERLTQARVEIRLGEARLSRLSTGEHLDLSGQDIAALLPVATQGARIFRLGRVREYSPGVAMQIAMGHPVIQMHQADGEAIAVLGGPDEVVTGYAIDRRELAFALDDMHSAMLTLVARLDPTHIDTAPAGTNGESTGESDRDWGGGTEPLESLATSTRRTVTELVHEVHGRKHRVIVSADGAVTVEHIGGETTTYASLESAQEHDPEAVSPLVAFLRRE